MSIRRHLHTSIAALVLTTALGGTAMAQNYSLPPAFGSIQLQSGFIPDPHYRNRTAGGNLRAQDRFSNCRGFIANAPDYSLYYTAGAQDLFINVDSDRDTTLVINGPDGRWYCDDDGAEHALNPLLYWGTPQSGRYDIWVGTYSSGAGVPATLFISELGEHTVESAGVVRRSATRVDISRPAVFGNVTLNGGFLPDPHRVPLTAGGHLQASSIDSSCRGYVTSAPSIEMSFNGYGSMHIYTEGNSDTTLAINGPDGRWYCNDDGGNGVNAGITLSGSGVYDVYVGTYGSSRAATTLMFSEIQIGYTPSPK